MGCLCRKSGKKEGYEHLAMRGSSTDDQNPDLRLASLKQAGCLRFFTDTATGAHIKRTELTKCLKALTEGDTLTVWKLDWLGQSLRDLIGLLDDLKARGVACRPLTEAIDTITATGRAAAIARGVKMDRKPKLSPQQVAQSLKVSRRTLYRALRG